MCSPSSTSFQIGRHADSARHLRSFPTKRARRSADSRVGDAKVSRSAHESLDAFGASVAEGDPATLGRSDAKAAANCMAIDWSGTCGPLSGVEPLCACLTDRSSERADAVGGLGPSCGAGASAEAVAGSYPRASTASMRAATSSEDIAAISDKISAAPAESPSDSARPLSVSAIGMRRSIAAKRSIQYWRSARRRAASSAACRRGSIVVVTQSSNRFSVHVVQTRWAIAGSMGGSYVSRNGGAKIPTCCAACRPRPQRRCLFGRSEATRP